MTRNKKYYLHNLCHFLVVTPKQTVTKMLNAFTLDRLKCLVAKLLWSTAVSVIYAGVKTAILRGEVSVFGFLSLILF